MTEEFGEHLVVVLKEMCRIVKAKYKDIDFHKNHWYQKYKWTEDEEKDFRKWLTEYVFSNKEARWELSTIRYKDKKQCKKFAADFTWNYGWKYKGELK